MPSWLKPFAWCVKWMALLAVLMLTLFALRHLVVIVLVLALGGIVVFPVMGAYEAWGERKWRRERAALAAQPPVHDQRLP